MAVCFVSPHYKREELPLPLPSFQAEMMRALHATGQLDVVFVELKHEGEVGGWLSSMLESESSEGADRISIVYDGDGDEDRSKVCAQLTERVRAASTAGHRKLPQDFFAADIPGLLLGIAWHPVVLVGVRRSAAHEALPPLPPLPLPPLPPFPLLRRSGAERALLSVPGRVFTAGCSSVVDTSSMWREMEGLKSIDTQSSRGPPTQTFPPTLPTQTSYITLGDGRSQIACSRGPCFKRMCQR
jgi:hypothetical protein